MNDFVLSALPRTLATSLYSAMMMQFWASQTNAMTRSGIPLHFPRSRTRGSVDALITTGRSRFPMTTQSNTSVSDAARSASPCWQVTGYVSEEQGPVRDERPHPACRLGGLAAARARWMPRGCDKRRLQFRLRRAARVRRLPVQREADQRKGDAGPRATGRSMLVRLERMTKRPKVPPAIKRALYAEAGYKCANPGCCTRLQELHHIRQWSVYQTHDGSEMIAICPT